MWNEDRATKIHCVYLSDTKQKILNKIIILHNIIIGMFRLNGINYRGKDNWDITLFGKKN